MIDFYEAIRANRTFKTFKVGDLLFAQYTCPLSEGAVGIWAHTDHLVHVLSGKKTWKTPSGSWTVGEGETMFFKKGTYVLHQNFQADFCVMLFFLPDTFMREVVRQLVLELSTTAVENELTEMAIPVRNDSALSGFLHSMAAYFAGNEPPPEALLRLKLRELITSILLSPSNHTLASHFRTIACSNLPSVTAIMEANCCHNLPLEAFAKMCHRSVSSFKRAFHECYRMPPGRWLHERRLERASLLLSTTQLPVTEIVFECGFESPAHFSRAFKEKFSRSPSEYRDAIQAATSARALQTGVNCGATSHSAA